MSKDKEKSDYASEDKGTSQPTQNTPNDMLPDYLKINQKSNDESEK